MKSTVDSERPNILWLSTHDINPHIGAYSGVYPGAQHASTPNLDQLAADGVRFDNAFATAPVCAPSRSSIMTGCFPISIGTMHMRSTSVPPPEVKLLSEYLRADGYYTTNNFFTDFQVPVPDSAFDEVSDKAHWRNRNPGQPFFAAFHSLITHESQIYLEEDEFRERTPHVPDSVRHDPLRIVLPPYHPDTGVFRRAWARYHDLITEMDAWVGDRLRELDDDDLARNTIVVFWSDHGLGMPRGKRWVTEAGLHEPLIIRWPSRIKPTTVSGLVHLMDLAPTMLAAAGVPVPEHFQGRALMDAAGRLTDEPNEYLFASRDRMDEQEDTSRSVRDRQFRYVINYHPDRSGMQHCQYPDELDTWQEMRKLFQEESYQLGRGEEPSLLSDLQRSILQVSKPSEELYDIVTDPFEERNLIDEVAYADTRFRLHNALLEWQRHVGDLGLRKEQELVGEWRPNGTWRVAETPVLENISDHPVFTCATDGASLVWTDTPPDNEEERTGGLFPLVNAGVRRWFLVSEFTPVPTDRPVWVRSWRLGFKPSQELFVADWAALRASDAPHQKGA